MSKPVSATIELSRHQVRLGSALKMMFGHKEQEKE